MFSGSTSLSHFSPANMAIWFSMAFQAGTINAGGFLATHRFVTHTTGFATYFGTEFAAGNISAAVGMLSVPVFFLLGSMISAFFVDRRLTRNEAPLYHWMFALVSLAMILISALGFRGAFGVFGEAYDSSRDYALLALLCLSSGLQNATITSASGAVVRTTHLTGITTDLGIGLVRVISPGVRTPAKQNELRANWMRIGLIVSYAGGSAAAAFLYYRYQYWGFVCPALISIVLFFFSMRKFKTLSQTGAARAHVS